MTSPTSSARNCQACMAEAQQTQHSIASSGLVMIRSSIVDSFSAAKIRDAFGIRFNSRQRSDLIVSMNSSWCAVICCAVTGVSLWSVGLLLTEPSTGGWPVPGQPGPCWWMTPAFVKLRYRKHTLHWPVRRWRWEDLTHDGSWVCWLFEAEDETVQSAFFRGSSITGSLLTAPDSTARDSVAAPAVAAAFSMAINFKPSSFFLSHSRHNKSSAHNFTSFHLWHCRNSLACSFVKIKSVDFSLWVVYIQNGDNFSRVGVVTSLFINVRLNVDLHENQNKCRWMWLNITKMSAPRWTLGLFRKKNIPQRSQTCAQSTQLKISWTSFL